MTGPTLATLCLGLSRRIIRTLSGRTQVSDFGGESANVEHLGQEADHKTYVDETFPNVAIVILIESPTPKHAAKPHSCYFLYQSIANDMWSIQPIIVYGHWAGPNP